MSGEVEAIAKGKIPQDFWNHRALEGREDLQEIHAMIVDRLQIEAPDADMLELMMMERVCFLYIFMRSQEQVVDGQEMSFDRTYKDMMSLWVSMAGDLRKQRLRAEETQGIRMSIVAEVSRALKQALKDVDPDIAKSVQTQLVTLVAV